MIADELLKEAYARLNGCSVDEAIETRDKIRRYLAEFDGPIEAADPVVKQAPNGFNFIENLILDQFRKAKDRSIQAYDTRIWRGVIKAFTHSPTIRGDIVNLLRYVRVNDMTDTLEESDIWHRILGWNERNGDRYAG